MSLQRTAILTLVVFFLLSLFLFVQHELHIASKDATSPAGGAKLVRAKPAPVPAAIQGKEVKPLDVTKLAKEPDAPADDSPEKEKELEREQVEKDQAEQKRRIEDEQRRQKARKEEQEHRLEKEAAVETPPLLPVELPIAEEAAPPTVAPTTAVVVTSANKVGGAEAVADPTPLAPKEARGVLKCGGKEVDSEIIYWKIVPGDNEYESPITPHHGIHHDRYLTYEYDQGGWNNVRMGMECLLVVAHAMGRTLVIPPQTHLYLLGKTHKDKEDTKAHDEMGFEDFFDLELLYSHKGMNIMHMEDFLAKEGVTGGLHGVLPPKNSTEAWGPPLWAYLDKVADAHPEWAGHFLAMPNRPGDFDLSEHTDPKIQARLKRFGGDRSPVFYDEKMQEAHHIHFPADGAHRVLQHHYAFAFFADSEMQSFYRRFVRDYMRYKDNIQCSGAELVAAVRQEALRQNPNGGGEYYALHVRRGDFQFKEVKIGAPEIVKNLQLLGGVPVIPPGSLVYLSTDDPEGLCKNCYAEKKPCETFAAGKKPVGCPEDTTWNAFHEAGWKVRFLHDFTKAGALRGVNPNLHGMVESIVCSRAKVFAGTYFSTFTGYIHRLRGYHGLGEATYYHSKQFFLSPQMNKSVGHGFSREWRAGWVDDEGELI